MYDEDLFARTFRIGARSEQGIGGLVPFFLIRHCQQACGFVHHDEDVVLIKRLALSQCHPTLCVTLLRTMAQWPRQGRTDNYSFDRLEQDGKTVWAGVKNPLAQKHLRSIRKGDRIFYYHTGKQKAVVGIARRSAMPIRIQRTLPEGFMVVDVAPEKKLPKAVTLASIKADGRFLDVSSGPDVAAVRHARNRCGVDGNRKD
jgi:predicted RNA-binding protein with PUA-like domain